jgi:hypothetical protein
MHMGRADDAANVIASISLLTPPAPLSPRRAKEGSQQPYLATVLKNLREMVG